MLGLDGPPQHNSRQWYHYLIFITHLTFTPEGPPDIPYITGSDTVTEGTVFTLKCYANNCYPSGGLHWFLNDKDITEHARQTNTEGSNGRFNMQSTLTYTLEREDNKKIIQCRASHETIQSPLRSDVVHMDVQCEYYVVSKISFVLKGTKVL